MGGHARSQQGRRKNKVSHKPFNFSLLLKTVLYLFKTSKNWRFGAKKVILMLSNKIVEKLMRRIGSTINYDNYQYYFKKIKPWLCQYKIHNSITLSRKPNRHYTFANFRKPLKINNLQLKFHDNPTVVKLRTDTISSNIYNCISIVSNTKVIN